MLNHLLNVVSYFCLKKRDALIIITITIIIIIIIIIIIPCLLSLSHFSLSLPFSLSFFVYPM